MVQVVAQEKMIHSKEEKELISMAKEYFPGGYLGNLYRDVIIDRGLAGHTVSYTHLTLPTIYSV